MPTTTYLSTDPSVVADVRAAKEEQAAWFRRVGEALSALPWSDGRADVIGMFGPAKVRAVMATDPAAARATGWKPMPHHDDLMVPMRGARGAAAREFLAGLGSCQTMTSVIGAHGAPEYVSSPGPRGTELISAVRAHLIGDAVHIEYPVEPTDSTVSRFSSDHRGAPDESIWTREPLSAFYAAKEAEASAAADALGEPAAR